MSLPTIFDTCNPRADVLDRTSAEADFAADLAKVISNEGSLDYRVLNALRVMLTSPRPRPVPSIQ